MNKQEFMEHVNLRQGTEVDHCGNCIYGRTAYQDSPQEGCSLWDIHSGEVILYDGFGYVGCKGMNGRICDKYVRGDVEGREPYHYHDEYSRKSFPAIYFTEEEKENLRNLGIRTIYDFIKFSESDLINNYPHWFNEERVKYFKEYGQLVKQVISLKTCPEREKEFNLNNTYVGDLCLDIVKKLFYGK